LSCDTETYPAVIRVREGLLVSKQATRQLNVERFYFKKASDVEGKDKLKINVYQNLSGGNEGLIKKM
jgi:hypothetical protein